MGRLLQAESNLELRFNYFDKPQRLDPGTFNSKDEIAPWHDSLKQLRDAEDLVEKLYADASTDLQNALLSRRIPGPLAARIKQQIIDSIPWPVVQRKEKVMGEFIDAHGKLLTFYEENWGQWDSGKPPGPPTFSDSNLTDAYQKLHDRITAAGQEIEQLYAKLRQ